jgi:hypothetical protein
MGNHMFSLKIAASLSLALVPAYQPIECVEVLLQRQHSKLRNCDNRCKL